MVINSALDFSILPEKIGFLRQTLRQLGSVLVAYSGGIDSTLLALLSTEELGKNAICATAVSPSQAKFDLNRAREIALNCGLNHVFLNSNELNDPRYIENSLERCYWCKREIFKLFNDYAKMNSLAHVIDGTNYDDSLDYRLGRIAAQELNIRSPLLEVGFTKIEIRAAAKSLDLPNWDAPNRACLSTRIPYRMPISENILRRIEAAEDFIISLGFAQVRLRHHDLIARIEVEAADFEKLLDHRQEIVRKLRQLEYEHITLDLIGYQTKGGNSKIPSSCFTPEENHGP